MAEQGYTKLICKYCTVQFRDMTDPRELPCHHVFCATCLRGDRRNIDGVFCPICREAHNSITIDNLPKATTEAEVATTPTTILSCDGHGCEDQLAVSHCVECGDNFCNSHQQTHNVLFGDKHEKIPIHVYEQSPKRFAKPICAHHQETIARVCKKCDKLICCKCDDDTNGCKNNAVHEFESTQSRIGETISYLECLLTSAEEKEAKYIELEKKMWKNLDIEENECAKRLKEIKWVCDEKIKLIKEESEMLIKTVYEHQEKITNQTEMFCLELMEKKDQLEEVKLGIYRLLRDSQITEQIRQKQKIAEELNKHEKEFGSCPLRSIPALIRSSNLRSHLNWTFVNTPSSLAFISEHHTGGRCLSANHKRDGDILVGTESGIHMLQRDSAKLTKHHTCDKEVHSILEYQNNVYILHRVEASYKVDMCLPGDLTKRQELFEFDGKGDYYIHAMAISSKCIVVYNPQDQLLIIYDFITKQTGSTIPAIFPFGRHFLPDEHLLTIGVDKLIKYKIENGDLSTIWSCDGLENGFSVTADNDGLIYVSSSGKRTIYIISPEGVMLQELTHDRLPEYVGDISVQDGILAVPDWYDRKLCLFTINRS